MGIQRLDHRRSRGRRVLLCRSTIKEIGGAEGLSDVMAAAAWRHRRDQQCGKYYVITLYNNLNVDVKLNIPGRRLRGYSRLRLVDPRSEKPIEPRRRSSQGKDGARPKSAGDGGGEPSELGSRWTVSE